MRRDLPVDRTVVRKVSAGRRVFIAGLVGVLVAVPVAWFTSPEVTTLIGWDVAAVVYIVWVWVTIRPKDAERTARLAVYEDPTRAVADLGLLGAAVVSLLAVGVTIARADNGQGWVQALTIGLTVASVVLSWAVVHTIFTLRYAKLYYTGPDGGVSFNQDDPPTYADFAYLAFTIGMTFQVSDTDIEQREVRRTALRHALLSYLFGTGIVATTVNLIVNLGTSGNGH
jgi:uncharacterized membrane protein